MAELGLHGALAGIYVLRGVDPAAPDTIVRAMAEGYDGPGVSLREGGIDQVTPYVRLDLRADGTVMLTGVAEDAVLRAWIPLLEAVIGV
jgi:hypothetical protein